MAIEKKADLPKQRVSKSQRRNKKWYIPNANFWIDRAESLSDTESRITLLNAANGDIDTKTVNYILKPFGSSNNELLQNFKMPGELRDTGMIKDILLKIEGRFSMTRTNFIVGVNNPDFTITKNETIAKEVNKYLQQEFINKLNEGGFQTGLPSQQQKDITHFVEELKVKYFDDRARQAKDTLDALRYLLDDELKYREAYFSWLVLGEYYAYRTIRGNMLMKDIIPTTEAFPIINNELFVDDYDGFLRKYRLSIDQVYDEFWDELEEEDKKYLDKIKEGYDNDAGTYRVSAEVINSRIITANGESSVNIAAGNSNSLTDYTITDPKGFIMIYHIVYPIQKKVRILKYNGITGIVEKEVTEDYVLNPDNGDIELEDTWVPSHEQLWRIGNDTTGIYIKPRSLEVDRGFINSTYKNKLNYTGKRGLLRYTFNHSIVARLIPFEILSRVYRLAIEREINKGLLNGAVMFIPKSILDDDEIDIQSNLYFMAADGHVIYDDSDPAKRQAVIQGAVKVVEPAARTFIEYLMKLDEKNKADAWDAIGWNRPMDGEMYASDGKGVTQQAIVQSSYSISLINEVFNKSRANDYEADLDYSKVINVENNASVSLGLFVDSDGNLRELNIDGETLLLSQLGIHVENSEVTTEKLKMWKDVAFSAAQNAQFDIAGVAIDSDNPKHIKQKLDELQEKIERRQKETEEAANKAMIEAEQIKSQTEQGKIQADLESVKMKEEAETFRTILKINAEKNNGVINDQVMKDSIAQQKLFIEQQKLQHKMRDDADKNQIKREDIRSKEKIAKENKNKYD